MDLPIKITLPDGFLDEEIRCDYFVSTEMKKVWAVELDLLSELQRICEQHNIKYYADSGTLLGAVRHKGFIPWDDDIDITMFREDYEKFIKIAANELEYPYFLQTPETENHYFRGHIQLRNSETTGILYSELSLKHSFNQGIFIDILPLDNLPDNLKERQSFLKRIKRINKIIKIAKKESFFHWYSTVLSKPIKFFVRLFGENKFVDKYNKMCCMYNEKSTEQLSYFSFNFGKENCVWNTCWYDDIIQLPFEFLVVKAPCDYDSQLKKTYGDYMKICNNPSSHGEVFFDASKSYKTYICGDKK